MSLKPQMVLDQNNNEVRTIVVRDLEERSKGDGGNKITGFAAVYEEFTEIRDMWGDKFHERIAKNAFRDTLSDGHDIFALKNHNWNQVIGRTGANLILEDRDTGLYFDLVPNQTSLGKDMLEDVRSGLIKGCSFGFRIVDQDWEERDGEWFRTINKAELSEITLTPIPAYSQTSAEVRSLTPNGASKPNVDTEQEERNAILAEANRIQKKLK